MGVLKPKEFYPDFHVNIRKDGRVNGIKPVTLKDMGLPYDLDYPEQPVGELTKEQYENLVEEFIFLIDELLPRDIQDLFYKATLDPRLAYWKLFEAAAKSMQLPYYLNIHRDQANGVYGNIRDGIECFIKEGRTFADIYLNTCITKEMLLDVVGWSVGIRDLMDEDARKLLYIELALFRSSKYNYKRFIKIPGCDVTADLILFNENQKPSLVVMVYTYEPEYDYYGSDDVLSEEITEEQEEELNRISQAEEYCNQHGISFLKLGQYKSEDIYEVGDLGKIIRQAIDNPEYAKEFIRQNEEEKTLEYTYDDFELEYVKPAQSTEKVQNIMTSNEPVEIKKEEPKKIRNSNSTDFIFCDVVFGDGGKTYCYLADDESYEVGEMVIVPAGSGNHEAVVKIVSKNIYSPENVPFPLDEVKHIIKHYDEE